MKFIEEVRNITRENQKEVNENIKNKIKEAAKKGLTTCSFNKQDIKPYEIDILKNEGFKIDKCSSLSAAINYLIQWDID